MSVSERTSNGERFVLDSDTLRVLPGQTVFITRRPQQRVGVFYWQRFVVSNPEHWDIHNISVGNFSLFPSAEVIPAQRLHLADLEKLGCRVGQDFTIAVTYVGDDPTGEPFVCEVFGHEALA